jgi:hypothetical protein
MSTATNPPPLLNDGSRADLQRKVCDPLEKLRGYIRLYVTTEGVAVLLIYLALWFWIGLALDYGFFRLFTVDWVQTLEGWWGLRLSLLLILISGLLAVVAVKVILRLTREFRNAALALVLERRFPQLLGDRLITAVELADPKMAQKYGYSQAMIDLTVQQAAEQVGKVPVQEAFNWKRLQRYGWTVAGLTLGLYALMGIGYALCGGRAGDYVQHFNNVASIWCERNLLLDDTYWPRQAHLEVLEDPRQPWKKGELRVGKHTSSVGVRVRAIKWVYADRKAPGGWRPLRWSDLNKSLLGAPVPPLPDGWAQLTMDEVERRADKERGELDANVLKGIRDAIEALTVQAGRVSMNRHLRLLELPDNVSIEYEGEKRSSGEITLAQDADDEFSGNFADLKESLQFRAAARDFRTLPRRITVVPPPAFAELYKEEAQPAYLYVRPPPGGTLDDLKGLKQRFNRERVYLGDENITLGVPVGTDLKLIGVLDKDLEKIEIIPRKERAGGAVAAPAAPPVEVKGKREFEVVFKNLSVRQDFDIEMRDSDGVSGRRRIVIEPKVDLAPEVDVFIDVVRKTNQGYMITPMAMVPFSGPARDEHGAERFNGRVRDDHGLSKVQYHFTYTRLESAGANRARAALAALALHLSAADAKGSLFAVAPYLSYVGHLSEPSQGNERETQSVTLPTFAEEMGRRTRNDLSRAELMKRLEKPLERPQELQAGITAFEQDLRKALEQAQGRPLTDVEFGKLIHTDGARVLGKERFERYQEQKRDLERSPAPLLTEFTLDADREVFDLQKHLPGLKETDERTIQPRYRLRLWLVATDNNVETGPRASESKDRFSLIVVSETELLAEIAKEEEGLHLKLEQTLAKLKASRTKLQQVLNELADPKFEEKTFSPLATRVLEIAEVVSAGSITAREVHTDYRRIVREEEVNRVTKEKIDKERNIVRLLDMALNQEFPRAEEMQREFQKSLESKQNDTKVSGNARDRLDALIARLQEVMDSMDKLTDINKLITMIKGIEEEQRDNKALLIALKKRIEEELLKGLLEPKN